MSLESPSKSLIWWGSVKKSLEDQDDGNFYGLGFICWVKETKKSSQKITFETYGIKTNVSLWFWHDNSNYEDGFRNILKVVTLVLQNTDGDAVFASVGNDPSLVRKDKRILLNPNSFFDDEDAMWRFKDIPFSNYEIKEMQMLA